MHCMAIVPSPTAAIPLSANLAVAWMPSCGGSRLYQAHILSPTKERGRGIRGGSKRLPICILADRYLRDQNAQTAEREHEVLSGHILLRLWDFLVLRQFQKIRGVEVLKNP